MAQILDLIPTVAAHCAGAPEPLVVRAYVDAAREFFRRTLAWKEDLEIDSEIAPGVLKLVLPEDAEITDGVFVRFRDDEKSLVKRTVTQMSRLGIRPYPRPTMYRVMSDRIFIAPVVPDIDLTVDITQATMALYPTRNATTLNDEVANRYGEAIEAGALSRLLVMPKRAWTDFESAAEYTGKFRAHIDEWRSLAADDGMVGVVRTVRYGGL